jgi:hypothetical protein
MRFTKVTLFIIGLVATFSLAVFSETSYRIVASAGGTESVNSYDSFYKSRVFHGEKAPFIISDSHAQVYRFNDLSIFLPEGMELSELFAGAPLGHKKSNVGFMGHSYSALPLVGQVSENLKRYLGAATFAYESYQIEVAGKTVIAFRAAENNKTVIWPESASQLVRIPAVVIEDKAQNKILMVARAVGAFEQRLAIIDHLLKNTAVPTSFFEFGDSKGRVNLEQVKLLSSRSVGALFPSAAELGQILSIKDEIKAPLVYPYQGAAQKVIKLNDSSGKEVNLWSLSQGEKAWSLYTKLGAPFNVEQGIEKMSESPADKSLNIVLVHNDEAAELAAVSVFVDLVIKISDKPVLQVAQEIIRIKDEKNDSYEQVAPIITLSAWEISEIIVTGDHKLNSLSKIEIKRHPIVDLGLLQKDTLPAGSALSTKVLPAMSTIVATKDAWEASDFDAVLGGLLKKSTGADVAIFESLSASTSIKGPLALDVALAEMTRPGRLSVINISGQQLKKIAKLINDNVFAQSFALYGVDKRGQSMGNRSINERERVTVAISQQALYEIIGLASIGGIPEDSAAERAAWVEKIYGDMKGLYFLSPPKSVASLALKEALDDAINTVSSKGRLEEIVKDGLAVITTNDLKNFINHKNGTAKHSIVFDIDYIDIGFSKNFTNDTYDYYLDEKNPSLPMGRGAVNKYAHLIFFSKMSLIYDAPELITSLGNTTRFMQTNLDKKPEKDKITFNLDFRLPWERHFFKESPVVISPVFKNTYETRIVPLPFLSDNTEAEWTKEKVLPRTNRFDSLLGFNFAFAKLGFDFDLGGTMATDFTRSSVTNALDFGPALLFNGKWLIYGPLEFNTQIKSYYLFALPKNTAHEKVAFGLEGTAYLRLARFYDFSLSLMSDFLLATLQDAPKELATSFIMGLTVSYGHFFRLFQS